MTITAPATTQPIEIPAIYRRMEVHAVPAEPVPAECGATTHARELAAALCTTLRGQTWQAVTRSPYMPHPMVELRSDIMVMIDGRHLVVVAHRRPAGTDRDLWSIRVNGRSIPHRVFPREIPHAIEPITRSVWRHHHGMSVDGCDSIGCPGAAIFATWGNRSMCRRCAQRYADTGQ
ncbi:hypothetical protein [Micromonospora sp. CPCC 206061]|uniref:hypothetical protein n=1 Tax=Micromonospora sp. CPCC 206061 TaxID=3122410 RepID=UPI002FF18E15